MRVAVVGCTHAGTAAILNTVKYHPEAEVVVYERNDNISFLSCGIALYVGGVVEDAQGLFYSSPEALADLGVETHMEHDVLSIDTDNKSLEVKDLKTGEVKKDTFDKLIVTTGSWPVTPPIKNSDLENIVLCKNYNHAKTIIEKSVDAKNVVVVGAGYIGVELVEAFEMMGKNVTLVDAQNRILSKYLDKEFTDIAEAKMIEKGIKLSLGECVDHFNGKDGAVTSVVTTGGEYEADLVVMCIGFKPNTGLLKGQVDMLDSGAIKVDKYMQTSKKDVFAAGDSCAIIYNPTGKHAYIPLATNAVRMGTLCGMNLVEPKGTYIGTQGTSGIKIYNHNIASTGLTVFAAEAEGMDVTSVTVEDAYRPEFMPTHENATLKVVYEKNSRKIKGAQLISDVDLTQSINTLSVAIQKEMTIDELAMVDFFFQPHYNKPWNLLNLAGLSAE